jgi:hypothetical protein
MCKSTRIGLVPSVTFRGQNPFAQANGVTGLQHAGSINRTDPQRGWISAPAAGLGVARMPP